MLAYIKQNLNEIWVEAIEEDIDVAYKEGLNTEVYD